MAGVTTKTSVRQGAGFAACVVEIEITCPHHRQAAQFQVLSRPETDGGEWGDEELVRSCTASVALAHLRCAPCDCARAVWARSWPSVGQTCAFSPN